MSDEGATDTNLKGIIGSCKKLFSYMSEYKRIILIALICLAISSACYVYAPTGISELVDEIIYDVIKKQIDLSTIGEMAIGLILLYIVSAALEYVANLILVKISTGVARKLRRDITQKMNRIPLKHYDSTSNGDIMSIISNDVDSISENMTSSLGILASALVLTIFSAIMMFYNNWIMALCVILLSVLCLLITATIVTKSQKHFVTQQENLGKMNAFIDETYSYHEIVSIYNNDNESRKRFDEVNDRLYESGFKSQFLGNLLVPIMNLAGNLNYVVVSIVGAILLLQNHSVTIGVIFAFMMYSRVFSTQLSQLSESIFQIQYISAAADRVFRFLDVVEMDPETDKDSCMKDIKGDVEFRDVRFGYEEGKEIIHGFTVKVAAGQKVAIVGRTGAGKTTIVNLLMRFYDVDGGDILIDGISINSVKRENVHEQFSMVLQDTWLFNGTVKENIRYCNEKVTDEAIVKACKAVGIHGFIDALPDGYDTLLSDKITMSAGQRQQLTIARAMANDAPIIILDEATSSIDTMTEMVIQDAMDKLAEGKTSFIIAHRLSTIRNADLILVMDKGDIVEQGTHQELIEKNGKYAELYYSQFT